MAGKPLRNGLIALAVLIPLVPAVLVVVLISLSGSPSGAAAALKPLKSTAASSTTPAHGTPPVSAVKPKLRGPLPSTVAEVIRPTELRSSPDGSAIAQQPVKTPFGSQAVLLVRRQEGAWLGVTTFLAGNNRLGWIPRADVRLGHVNYSLEVSLDQRKLTVLKFGKVLERYTIAIGKPSSPTPTGTFAVTDLLRTGDPEGAYGCCIMALSALAPHAIQDWNGGSRIAVHSTPDTSTIGDAVSHGCMHVTLAEGEWLLDHVPLGTPITIRSD